jgi:beta-lactam-binding protein with PASTA domain
MKPPATPRVVFGGTYPTMMWHDFMAAALEGQPFNEFPEAAPRYRAPATQAPVAEASIDLPNVVGQTYEQAVAQLSAAGFTSIARLDRAADAAPGTVVDMAPKGQATRTTTITLYVSVTPGARVPSVLGQTAAEAQAALQAQGFVVQVQTQARDGAQPAEAGRVWRTNPDPNAPAFRGQTVVIFVNPTAGGGPPPTAAPTAPPPTDTTLPPPPPPPPTDTTAAAPTTAAPASAPPPAPPAAPAPQAPAAPAPDPQSPATPPTSAPAGG